MNLTFFFCIGSTNIATIPVSGRDVSRPTACYTQCSLIRFCSSLPLFVTLVTLFSEQHRHSLIAHGVTPFCNTGSCTVSLLYFPNLVYKSHQADEFRCPRFSIYAPFRQFCAYPWLLICESTTTIIAVLFIFIDQKKSQNNKEFQR